MSKVISSSDNTPSKLFTKPFHHRNNSDGELDVFEATNYFSGHYNELPTHHNRVRRVSLDNGTMIQTHQIIKAKSVTSNGEKKHKPSSPGGKLASFLNQLFNQGGGVGSNKKKNKKLKSAKVEDETSNVDGGRKKRRSSISLITRSWNSSNTNTSISITNTTTSTTSSSNPKAVSPLPIERRDLKGSSWLDEKMAKLRSEKIASCGVGGNGYGDGDVDVDGYESDSSSDLFELPNYDSNVYSNGGLPVYETTKVSSISASTI